MAGSTARGAVVNGPMEAVKSTVIQVIGVLQDRGTPQASRRGAVAPRGRRAI
jgi:hypothetical protein